MTVSANKNHFPAWIQDYKLPGGGASYRSVPAAFCRKSVKNGQRKRGV